MATPISSPNPRSPRTSTSSNFLDEKEFMFLANRSEQQQQQPLTPKTPKTPKTSKSVSQEPSSYRPNIFLTLIRETYGAIVSDTLTLFSDLMGSVWRWVMGLARRSRTCVVSVVGLLGGFVI